MASTSLAFAALLAALGGVALLRLSWRWKTRLHGFLVAAGWLTLAASLVLAVTAFGAEVGPPVILTAWSLAGIAAVLGNLERRTARVRAPRSETIDPDDTDSGWLHFAFHLLSACLLTGIAAFLSFVLLAQCLFLPTPNAVLFGVFALLLLWSLFAIWASSDRRVFRTAAMLAALAGLSYAATSAAGVCA